jgi:hypothetical protein
MGLIDYIKGNRRGKEANRIERDAMTDAFLQEALDGYDSVISNHIQSLERLQQKVNERSMYRRRNHMAVYLSVAAVVIVLLTVGTFFVYNNPFDNTQLISKNEQKPESVSTYSIHKSKRVFADSTPPPENPQVKTVAFPPPVIACDKDVPEESSLNQANLKKSVNSSVKMVTESRTEANSSNDAAMANVAPAQSSSMVQEEIAPIVADKKVAESATKSRKDAKDEPVVNGYSNSQKEKAGEKTEKKFEERQFKAFFMSRVKKGVCGDKKNSVEVEFLINGNQYPSTFRFNKFSCDEAKNEVIRILSYSPRWTEDPGKKIKMKLSW